MTRETETTPLLRVSGLTKEFPVRRGLTGRTVHLRAVDDVTLSVDAGDTLAVVGESGCGKSTTARMIVGLTPPTRGAVEFEGADLATADRTVRRRARASMQMVFQDPHSSLSPRMTAGEIIAEPLRINGTERAEARRRVGDLLERVGLRDSDRQRYAHEFSGGQRQRIGIARALATSPRLLVLDEPVSALDVSVQAQVLNLLIELQGSLGLSYVLISHNIGVVRHVARRVAVMYLGSVVESGPTATVFARPSHPYTRALVDAVPVPDPSVRGVSEDRTGVAAELPDPLGAPSGCPFRTRCPRAQSLCETEKPALTEVAGAAGGSLACHFPLGA